MGNQQLLLLFLKAFVAAKKSVGLYPAGSEMATTWVRRLHRSLDGFFEQGLSFPIRVGRDRFLWGGEDVLTIDPTLEALRFDLETRGIADFSMDRAVEDWELQAFLEVLSQPPQSLDSISGISARLRAKNVVHISVGTPSAGGIAGKGSAADQPWQVAPTGKDELDLFVEAVLQMTEARLIDLTFDRTGLAAWLTALGDGDRADRLYSAVKMLATMAEGSSDREIRMRTVLEAVLLLPALALGPLLTKWLVPLAGSDLVAFNLLTQVTEDELRGIARLVPQEQLLSLTTELLEFPWEEGKKQRILEAIIGTVQRQNEPGLAVGSATVVSRDDPLLVELRAEIMDACHPDVLLARSAEILLALVFNVESEEYPESAVDAMEEILGEALGRGRLDLAVRMLSSLGASTHLDGERMREHSRRLALFRRRVAGRAQISLVAGLLRQNASAEHLALTADYLRLVPGEGVEEFTTLLADERDRRVRARMCQVLARVGPSIIPVLLRWLEDSRWYVVRNVLYVLGKLGDASTFTSAVAMLDHSHPRVRVEAVRALGLIGGGLASEPLLRRVTDPDPAVRRAVVKSLGSLRNDDAVPALRDLVTSPVRASEDLEIKQEAINALATIGSPLAQGALVALASRHVWFWERRERRLRAIAAEAVRTGGSSPVGTLEGDDGE